MGDSPEIKTPVVVEKLSKRRKQFILEYTQNGRNAIQAALTAGYPVEDVTRIAFKLMRDPAVKSMIDKVYGKVVPDSGKISRDIVNDLYFDAIVASKRNGNTRDLINAINGLARLHGLEVNKHEVKNEHSFTLSDLISDSIYINREE